MSHKGVSNVNQIPMLDEEEKSGATVYQSYHEKTMQGLVQLHEEVLELHRQIEGTVEGGPEAATIRTRRSMEKVVMGRIMDLVHQKYPPADIKKRLGVHLARKGKSH